MAFSLALPLWGSLMSSYSPRELLASGCMLWGSFTFIASWCSSFWAHFLLRLLIGASLAVVMPIGQSIICDLFSQFHRGTAFGIMSSLCAVVCRDRSRPSRLGLLACRPLFQAILGPFRAVLSGSQGQAERLRDHGLRAHGDRWRAGLASLVAKV